MDIVGREANGRGLVPQTIENVQYLRFIAAALVLFGHSVHEAIDHGAGESAKMLLSSGFWGGGVDVFFVISGFIMCVISSKGAGRPGYARKFLIDRIRRITPNYWLVTAAMLAIAVFAPSVVRHSSLNAAHIASSLFYVPWRNQFGKLHPVMDLGWTLNYEMFFYVIFYLSMLAAGRRALWVIVGTLFAAAFAGMFIDESMFMLFFWTRPIILEFAFGIALGVAYLRGVRLSFVPAFVLALVGLLFCVGLPVLLPRVDRAFTAGLPAFATVAGAAFSADLLSRAPKLRQIGLLAGAASYALYLTHPFAINISAVILRKAGLDSPAIWVASGVVSAICGAMLFYSLFEQPADKILRRLSAKPRSPVAGEPCQPGGR